MNFILACAAVLIFGAMACMTYLSGRPGDHTNVYVLLTAIVTGVLPILVGIGKVIIDGEARGKQNEKIIQQLDGHTDILRVAANTAGIAEGRAAEVKDQRARDDRTATTQATTAAAIQMQAAQTQERAADVQAQAAGIVPTGPGD